MAVCTSGRKQKWYSKLYARSLSSLLFFTGALLSCEDAHIAMAVADDVAPRRRRRAAPPAPPPPPPPPDARSDHDREELRRVVRVDTRTFCRSCAGVRTFCRSCAGVGARRHLRAFLRLHLDHPRRTEVAARVAASPPAQLWRLHEWEGESGGNPVYRNVVDGALAVRVPGGPYTRTLRPSHPVSGEAVEVRFSVDLPA